MGRKSLLAVFLGRGVLPPCPADRPILLEPVAEADRRGRLRADFENHPACWLAKRGCAREQSWADHGGYDGAAQSCGLSDRFKAVQPEPGKVGQAGGGQRYSASAKLPPPWRSVLAEGRPLPACATGEAGQT